jgi:TonB family protein
VTPQPTLPERLANIFKTEPVKPTPDLTPVEKPVKSQPHKIQPNLTPTVRTAPKNPTPDNSRQSPRLSQNDFQKLREKLSQTTEVTMPGVSSESYASYRDALATIYYNAWVTPNGAANDEADTIVKITVASDGTVINAHITTPSGDEKTDASVRRALDRVSSVPPLPDKAKSEQEFTIDFNLKTKRTLE